MPVAAKSSRDAVLPRRPEGGLVSPGTRQVPDADRVPDARKTDGVRGAWLAGDAHPAGEPEAIR